jgi:hypothetical protein
VAIRIICTLAVLACFSLAHVETVQAQESANNCVALIGYKGTDPKYRSHIIKNNCTRPIGIAYCHSPSSMPGTKDSVCGDGGQYYQQRISLRPGETHANAYSEPADARLSWAACFDNQFYIKQRDSSSNQFYCDYPNKR